ncbi:MAG: hypothetical protein PVJ83_04645 [Gammaproteobacteria bacterium]|jgi:tetratricopeptide (TPR) repeat protein
MASGRTLLLLLGLALACAGSAAEPDKPSEVLDLQYGEVLFHFYQEDYFTAITHLMAAQRQQLLEHHRKDSELLLGGMQLSYGLLDQAEARFRRLLDRETDTEIHDRAWYYLTRLNYQRGHYDEAYATLQEIGTPRDRALAAELALLGANLDMELGRDADAAELLKRVRAPEGWQEYLDINRGIALLRAGDIEQGRKVLESVGTQRADSEELRSLRDRANLGLGFELLRADNPELARVYFNRVRLQGAFEQEAMLGAGWADAETGDYAGALVPWMHLAQVGGHQSAAQEAHLAVPYAFARMGDNRRAADFYEQALDYYDEEQRQIEQAIKAARGGTLIALLDQVDSGTSGGWLHDAPTLEGVPSGRYLVDVLSGNEFQESLKDYRDLGFLSTLLGQWLASIDLYHDMVDARRQAYQARAPGVRKRLARQEAAGLQARWRQFDDLVKAESEHGDPVHLATGKEKQQWALLEDVKIRLANLPDEAHYDDMRARADWLQGVLYWQLSADYKKRLWNVRKQLTGIESQLQETVDRHHQVEDDLENIKAGFQGYDRRIEALRTRILGLLPGIAAARDQSGQHLQQLALAELETRMQRLMSYRSQARYALARSYDQLARTQGTQP